MEVKAMKLLGKSVNPMAFLIAAIVFAFASMKGAGYYVIALVALVVLYLLKMVKGFWSIVFGVIVGFIGGKFLRPKA